jgi:hypothetical protein
VDTPKNPEGPGRLEEPGQNRHTRVTDVYVEAR